jgi:hypothetical protein
MKMKGVRHAWWWCALAVLSAATLIQPRSAAQTAGAAIFAIEPLTSPAGAESTAPQLTVSADRMILSWLETGHHATLKYAERTATGWSAASTVVSSENVVANWADVPSVRALGDGRLVAQWLEKNSPDPEAYDMRLSVSKDRGRTWTALRSPHGDQTKTQHGFASFFEGGPAGFGLVWLDGRETAKAGGAMTLRSTRYESPGAGGETLVAPRVCDCCPTAAATTSDGAIVAFRNRTADDIRDIYITRWNGQAWSAPGPVHNDGWKINGCPVNGPALAARGRDVTIAWFTAPGGAGRSFAAFSADAGRTFGAPVRVDDEESSGRMQVAVMKDGAAAVSWIESAKPPSQLRVRRVTKQGARSLPVTIAYGLGTQFPRMAAAQTEIVFAWVENSRGSSRVRTARAKM